MIDTKKEEERDELHRAIWAIADELRDEWRRKREDKDAEDITDDLVFEIELIRQIEINIDYILLWSRSTMIHTALIRKC